jgi:hypothetical protein
MEVILNDFENTISTDLKENIKNHITLDHFKSIKDQISDFLLNGLKKYEDRFIDYLNYIISESEENQLKQNPNFKKYS